jgi:hypothetical protein
LFCKVSIRGYKYDTSGVVTPRPIPVSIAWLFTEGARWSLKVTAVKPSTLAAWQDTMYNISFDKRNDATVLRYVGVVFFHAE